MRVVRPSLRCDWCGHEEPEPGGRELPIGWRLIARPRLFDGQFQHACCASCLDAWEERNKEGRYAP